MPQIALDLRNVELANTAVKAEGDLAASQLGPSLRLNARWLDATRSVLTDWQDIGQPQTVMVEHSLDSEAPEWSAIPLIPSFEMEIPENGAFLAINLGLAETILARDTVEIGPNLAAPRVTTLGSPNAQFRLAVIAERFASTAEFDAHCSELSTYFQSLEPFNAALVAGTVAIDFLFWQSDEISGLFGTDDGKMCGDLFYGNREKAKSSLSPWLANRQVSLILINSTKRGGAGGTPGWSAWASSGSPDWKEVCGHEVGHGCHLADEYQTSGPNITYDRQPNVSDQAAPSATPWGKRVNTRVNVGDSPAPSHDGDEVSADDLSKVGTFRGAFYDATKWFRPTATCLMRTTAPGSKFCIVCNDAITEFLAQV